MQEVHSDALVSLSAPCGGSGSEKELARGSEVMDKGCWGVHDPVDLPGEQVIHVLLLFPDSEDRENLQRNGVTHILSVHNRAEPVLEVGAWVGGIWGVTPG